MDSFFVTQSGFNPYRRCSHRCVYCISFTQGRAEPWYSRDEVLNQVRAALPNWPEDRKIALCDMTDPYPPEEEKERVTRLILEELHRLKRPYFICTKGTLLTRDFDILSDYSVDHDVWIVLGALDKEALSMTEPGAPSPQARIEVMHKLAEAGIRFTVNAAPLLPWITSADDLVNAIPHEVEVIHMCPLQVQHMGSKIKLFGRQWTQSELSASFFAAGNAFTPRPNVQWHDPMPETCKTDTL